MTRININDCVYLDKETGWCKKHSDWSDAMPILEYCLESPCGDYRPLKDDNLDDLISRSAAIEALTNAMSMTGYQSRAIDAVRFLPTIEAKPVRYGRWYIPTGMMPAAHHGRHRCSVCGHMALYERPGKECLSAYCPNCFAKMEGSASDG